MAKRQTPPKFIGDRGKPYWAFMIKLLESEDLLNEADTPCIAVLCDTLGDYVYYRDQEIEHGSVSISEKGGEYQSPYASLKNNARKCLVDLMADLGLTPAGRKRLQLALAQVEADNIEAFRQKYA